MSTPMAVRTDEEIQSDVLDELRWDARVQPNEIGVAVRSGIVTLSGSVDRYQRLWAAERAAYRVRGVRQVANAMSVRLPRGDVRADIDLAVAATRALEWDAEVPLDAIEVAVDKGCITIRGEVEWHYQRIAAERAVASLTGVRAISSKIIIRPRVIRSGTELKREIKQALARDVETDAARIGVEADGGTVVLTGVAPSWLALREAARVAWSAPGVESVDARVLVEPAETTP